jgi:hypothetical protein
MNHSVRKILQSEFSATGSQIAVRIEITLNVAVNRAHESVEADVEFTLVN